MMRLLSLERAWLGVLTWLVVFATGSHVVHAQPLCVAIQGGGIGWQPRCTDDHQPDVELVNPLHEVHRLDDRLETLVREDLRHR